jgi:hypothetical protein
VRLRRPLWTTLRLPAGVNSSSDYLLRWTLIASVRALRVGVAQLVEQFALGLPVLRRGFWLRSIQGGG